MARAATALIATCLLCLAALVDAQTCELWAGEPAACSAYLNGTVVFVNGNQSDVAALIAPQAALLVAGVQPAAPACFVRLMPLLCRSAFPACASIDVPGAGKITLWTPQCRSACEDANLACNPVFLASGQAPQDCTQSVPGSPLPLFPDGDLVVPLAPGLNASSPCQAQAPFVCPTTKDGVTLKRVPLDRRNETNGFSCWDCPVPVFASPTQYKTLWWGTAILGGIGILLCIWTIVPILIDRARRTYPSVCTVYLTMAALMVDCVFVVTAMAGWKDTYCEEPWLPARFKHAPCVVQGFFVYMTTMWLLIWSSVIIFNVWYIVVMEAKPSRMMYNWQLGLGWGVPIFFGFLAGVLRQYSYDGFAYCFIADVWPPYSEKKMLHPWIGMVFWYWPFAVMLVVNSGLILNVIFKCIKTGVAGVLSQWRTIAYFIFYAYTCGFAIVMWLRAEATRQKTNDSAGGYIACLFFSLDSRACEPAPGYPPVNAGVALFWTLACTSVWCFLSFGTSPDHLKCWLNLPGAMRKGDWSFESLQFASSSLGGSLSAQRGNSGSGIRGSNYSASPRNSDFRL